jgi:sterol desaturase/sphingolipid hydroxylase (fatty acid hydroxylase superfamily)
MTAPPIRPELFLLAMGPVFLAFIAAEYWFYRKRNPERFDTKDMLNNILLSALNQAAELFFLSIHWLAILALGALLYKNGLKLVPREMSWAWFFVLFVAQDFLYYWFHRASHRVRWFWTAHVAHHSSEYLNFSTALRQSVLYPFTGMPLFWLPLAWLGFSSEWIALIVALNLFIQFFVHTQAIKNLGPLEWVLNTPSHHRVHHAKNPRYIDKNYAGVFIVWDRLFGSFVEEDEPCVYGITKKVNFRSPYESNLRDLIELLRELRRANGVTARLGLIFGPPR